MKIGINISARPAANFWIAGRASSIQMFSVFTVDVNVHSEKRQLIPNQASINPS